MNEDDMDQMAESLLEKVCRLAGQMVEAHSDEYDQLLEAFSAKLIEYLQLPNC